MSGRETDLPISSLRGIGQKRAEAFRKLGLVTLSDLLRHYPRAYQNRGKLCRLCDASEGEKATFRLTVGSEPKTTRIKNRITLTKFRAFDESGSTEVVFFNQPYVSDIFRVGQEFRFYGALSMNAKHRQLSSPQYEPYREGEILPDFISLYPVCEGITQKTMASAVAEALRLLLPTLRDPLPDSVRVQSQLPTLSFALSCLHQPTDEESLSRALRRVVFDELLCLGLGISLSKSDKAGSLAEPCKPCKISPLTDQLPYALTNAQKRAINEIYADMTGRGYTERCPAMRRILIGDVGCGKTVCAAAAIYIAIASGKQAALMVPTSVLAEQHYRELSPLFSALGYETALLTGSTKAKERREILSKLSDASHPLPLIIGTHALLSDDVSFSDLALTVTDEQHRFGVMQRARLKEKYASSHTLVMSATPIPRTLAHVLYGDLSVSRIDEMPVGRQRVDTYVVGESYRARLNAFIRRQVEEGGQVYIVCPSIEERREEADDESNAVPLGELLQKQRANDAPPLKNAVEYSAELARVFPDLSVALLHGKMKQAEKDAVMADFVLGKVQILVSTTVIEVGVNVPRATLMIVENAERFGLSQLHQLRGRVGRGTKKSYCVLVSDSRGENARSRLEAMKTTYDGYAIAERDLALRGPGDFFAGTDGEARQAGGLTLRLASCCNDTALMEQAFSAAAEITASDPTLSRPENAGLRDEVFRVFTINENTIS